MKSDDYFITSVMALLLTLVDLVQPDVAASDLWRDLDDDGWWST